MTRIWNRVIDMLLVLALLSGLTAIAKVKIFPSKKYDVSTYKTYQWEPVRIVTKQGFVEDDPDVSPIIRDAINRELAKKGYTEVAEGGELLLLTAGLNVRSSQLEGFLLTWGFDIYWGYGVTTVSPLSRVNNQGTLLVNLIDAKRKKGVWSGFATNSLRPNNLEKTINKAAAGLFKKMPPSKR